MSAQIGLSGKALQQSPDQWAERGRILSASMFRLITDFRAASATTALDVGCQDGTLLGGWR